MQDPGSGGNNGVGGKPSFAGPTAGTDIGLQPESVISISSNIKVSLLPAALLTITTLSLAEGLGVRGGVEMGVVLEAGGRASAGVGGDGTGS